MDETFGRRIVKVVHTTRRCMGYNPATDSVVEAAARILDTETNGPGNSGIEGEGVAERR